MKIYIDKNVNPIFGNGRHNELPFHFEKFKWTYVDSIQDADIVPIVNTPITTNQANFTLENQLDLLNPYLTNKLFLLMSHTHSSENMGANTFQMYLNKYPTNSCYIVSANFNIDLNKHIHYDFYFNLIKGLFTEYANFDFTDRQWIGNCNAISFGLLPIEKIDNNCTKKFLIPNITRDDENITFEFKNEVRLRFRKDLKFYESFYSDNTKNIWLQPEQLELFPSTYSESGPGIIPIANYYYKHSFISAYVETVARHVPDSPVSFISEKTYLPLIKGHFILPFAYPGIIKNLKEKGFLFPKWIDYSYDEIYNDEERYRKYKISFYKLVSTPIKDLICLANNDIHIREHNRKVFYSTPYDSLYDKVKGLLAQLVERRPYKA